MACQACGRNAPTKYVEFYQNIGMLVVRSMRSIKGNMCKRCIRKHFLNLTGLTLVTGWWGMISFILNPFLILNNVIRYLLCLRLPDGGDQAFPVTTRAAVAPAVAASSAGPQALAPYRQDIQLRLRGGQTPQQIAAFLAPRAGVAPAVVLTYIQSLQG